MIKKSRQKFKCLENKKSFLGEIKTIFHHFWRAFSCKKYLKPEIVPLNTFYTSNAYPPKVVFCVKGYFFVAFVFESDSLLVWFA